MWPLRIENPIFLQNIYGNYPDLSAVKITSANFHRDGPTLSLAFLTDNLPYRPPNKWGQFNTVAFSLDFFGIEKVSVRQFGRYGLSSVRMWDKEGKILLMCDGTVRLSLTCEFLRIADIRGLNLEM